MGVCVGFVGGDDGVNPFKGCTVWDEKGLALRS
jgi:hypothetical protein